MGVGADGAFLSTAEDVAGRGVAVGADVAVAVDGEVGAAGDGAEGGHLGGGVEYLVGVVGARVGAMLPGEGLGRYGAEVAEESRLLGVA